MIRSVKELRKHTFGILPIGTVVQVKHKMTKWTERFGAKADNLNYFTRDYRASSFYRTKTGVITGLKRCYTGTYYSDRDATEPHDVKAALFYRVRFGMLNAEVLCDPCQILSVQGMPVDFKLPITERQKVKWSDKEKRDQSEYAREAPRDPKTGQFQKESFTAGG